MKKMKSLPRLKPAICIFTSAHITIQLLAYICSDAKSRMIQAMGIIENMECMQASIFIINGASSSQTKNALKP